MPERADLLTTGERVVERRRRAIEDQAVHADAPS
jgi:hypothetical protein